MALLIMFRVMRVWNEGYTDLSSPAAAALGGEGIRVVHIGAWLQGPGRPMLFPIVWLSVAACAVYGFRYGCPPLCPFTTSLLLLTVVFYSDCCTIKSGRRSSGNA